VPIEGEGVDNAEPFHDCEAFAIDEAEQMRLAIQFFERGGLECGRPGLVCPLTENVHSE
jgi:hypothetical protein